MPQWLKVTISALTAGLTTYGAATQASPDHGVSIPAAIGAVVAALNAVGNLYVQKPNEPKQ